VYLFDTDTITNPLKPQPSAQLLVRLAALTPSQQHVSAVTLAEIAYGAWRSARPQYHLDRLRQLILPRVRVLSFDENAAYEYGRVRADLERAGTPLHSTDLQIASVALSHGLILVTGNLRHFGRIQGLAVENWL